MSGAAWAGTPGGPAAKLSRLARRWQTITVHLLSGRGEMLTHPPGRVFILPPRTTFDALGRAIDIAFALWDLSHLREFTLADGTIDADDDSAGELRSSMSGTVGHQDIQGARHTLATSGRRPASWAGPQRWV